MIKTVVWVNCFFAILHCCSGDAPEVKIPQGSLKGAYFDSVGGRKYAAFMSVPYAKPPIGPLRFMPPVETEGWEGVRDASKDSPHCIQSNTFLRDTTITGDEDCLYLNIYTPEGKTDGSLMPVIVLLHPGGWLAAASSKAFYGPDRFMDRDVVFIGVNHRLGALGMLSTMDEASYGNWALKDQNMALRWINKHITHFGGDPNLVTLFGGNAGAASIHYHMMSPKSQGLFHRGILCSGSALSYWGYSEPGEPLKKAIKMGKLLDCPTDDNKLMIECLRTKDARDILVATKFFFHWDFEPMIPFRPVVEPQHADAFITEDPWVQLKEGRFAQIPILTGVNEYEGAIRSAGVLGAPELFEEFSENFDELAPYALGYELSNEPHVISKALKDIYLQGSLSIDKYLNITDIYSDANFISGMDVALELILPKATKPVYFYRFTFRGKSSFSELAGDRTKSYGASHGDEMIYLMKLDYLPQLEGKEIDVTDAVITIWTNFAKTGDPSSPIRETKIGTIPTWSPLVSADKWNHVQIDNDLVAHDDLVQSRRLLWRSFSLRKK